MTFKQLRKKKKVSQRQIEQELQLSNSTVSKWEHGNLKPKLDKITQLAELLRCSTEEVINCFRKDE